MACLLGTILSRNPVGALTSKLPIGALTTKNAIGTLTCFSTDMANYIINRYDLTGLIGGTSVKLDGLSAATLAQLPNGTRLQIGFTGGITAQYKLRAKGADVESAPWIIVFDNANTRCAELEQVHKQGVPCGWNPTTVKFHQLLVSGSGTNVFVNAANESDAFTLPT